MRTLPSLNDACIAEYRSDVPGRFPGTVRAVNGSLMATTDYELMAVFAREVLEVSK